MNDVPLIQKADINSINTSIIAIKKQLKQLNEALGLVDVPSIDTSVFVKKSDVVDVVQSGNMNPVTSNAVVPVDTVTSGNMQSVTSNAVASAISSAVSGKLEWALRVDQGAQNAYSLANLPQGLYLVFIYDLYHGYSYYNFGYLVNYTPSARIYKTISNNALTISLSSNLANLVAGSGQYIWSIRMIKVGY